MPGVSRVRDLPLIIWLLVVCAVSGRALQQGHVWLRVTLPADFGMCQGLPRYDRFAGLADSSQAVTFAVQAGLSRHVERQFCAQYRLAPVVLRVRNEIDVAALLEDLRQGPVLVDDPLFDAPQSPTRLTLQHLTTTGRAVVQRQTPDGLVLLTLP